MVGVDGSDASIEALRWARDEAAARHATLGLVHAWSYPYAGDLTGMAASVRDESSMMAEAQAVLDGAIEVAVDTTERLCVTTRLVHGAAAQALLDESAGADLLVVGSRGHGGFVGLLLGSVSQQCTHHADCPIVVVPGGART